MSALEGRFARQILSRLVGHPAFLSVVRIGGAGLGFVAQCILAWILTPERLGIFYSLTSLAAIAGILAAQGYPQIAARFTARYRGAGGDRLFARFVVHALSESMAAAVLAGLLIVLFSLLAPGLTADAQHALWFSSVLVMATTLLNVMTNLAGAMKYFGLCYVPEGLFRPMLFLLATGVLWVVHAEPSAALVTAAFTAVTLGVAVVTYGLIREQLPIWRLRRPRAQSLEWRWRSEAWKLILLSMFTNVFVDTAILLATPFLTSADIAVFGLITRISMLSGYIVQVAQQMCVPDMAQSLKAEAPTIQGQLRKAIFGPSVVLFLSLICVSLIGDRILMVFGPSFAAAQWALFALMLTQFIRALAGPSWLVITLSGAQGLNASLCAVSIVVLLACNTVLVPLYGLNGAAYAVLATYCFWMAACGIALRMLGLPRTDIGSLFKLPNLTSPRLSFNPSLNADRLSSDIDFAAIGGSRAGSGDGFLR